MMTHAIRIHAYGDASVLRWEEVEVPAPGRGEAQVRQTAVGVNFIDVYHRTGLYPVGGFPCGVGLEGAGVVEAVGPGVSEVDPGDRVAYAAGRSAPMQNGATSRPIAWSGCPTALPIGRQRR